MGLVLAACAGCRGTEAMHPESEVGLRPGETVHAHAVAETRPAGVVSADAGAGNQIVPLENPPDPGTWWRLPDGTYVPALNGVVGAPPMVWPEDRPFSPITHKETGSNGIEWYLHADGTASTTAMIFRKDLGREDATALVAHPKR
jgi:hypothetical protein